MSETIVVIEQPLNSRIVVNVEPTEETSSTVLVEPIEEQVSVVISNQQGPQGIPGIQGPPGADGGPASVFYTHNQSIPSDTWVINHNLSGRPTAVVMDSAGTMCEGYFQYPSLNQMIITFSSPFSGTAYII